MVTLKDILDEEIRQRRSRIKRLRAQIQQTASDMVAASIDCRGFTSGLLQDVDRLHTAETELEVLLDTAKTAAEVEKAAKAEKP